MYYVATPKHPFQNNKLHHGENVAEMIDWAENEARTRGIDLDVRDAATREVHASFNGAGVRVKNRS